MKRPTIVDIFKYTGLPVPVLRDLLADGHTDTQGAVYLLLLGAVDRELGLAHVPSRVIAQHLGKNEKTIREAITALVADGRLTPAGQKAIGSPHPTNLYKVKGWVATEEGPQEPTHYAPPAARTTAEVLALLRMGGGTTTDWERQAALHSITADQMKAARVLAEEQYEQGVYQ